MGLDSYIYYSCPFRPDGEIETLTRMLQYRDMVAMMDQHGQSSVTLRRFADGQAVDHTIHRADIEPEALALRSLPETCAACPAGTLTALNGSVPGCRARVNYPLDEAALEVLGEALELNAYATEPEELALIQSLTEAGDCDGRRMERVMRNLGAEPSPAGLIPVEFEIDGRVVTITPYMVLEHVMFRRFLDPGEIAEVLQWFRFFYQAIGERIATAPGPVEERAGAIFGPSPSLRELNILHKVVASADEHGWSLQLDG